MTALNVSATPARRSPVRALLLLPVVLLGALAIGFAVPLLWLWIGSKIQGTSGVTHMTSATAIAMFPGVVITYALLLQLVARVRGRFSPVSDARQPPRRYSWNRSMRDEPEQVPVTTLEKTFIASAVIASLAFEMWFFLYAGPPI